MSIRWTKEIIEKLQEKGKIQGYVDKTKAPDKPIKKAKYNNKKVEWNDMLFDSKKEYRRYRTLLILEKKGIIIKLERQIVYELIVNGHLIAKYICDHRYRLVETYELIVEDVKSEETRKLRPYRMKKKLMKSLYNIEIKEV